MEDVRAVVISLHEKWWREIVSGGKQLEIRKLSLPEIGVKKAPQSWCYIGG